jgi:Zn-dependent M28 family amino/carboxypeptidase
LTRYPDVRCSRRQLAFKPAPVRKAFLGAGGALLVAAGMMAASDTLSADRIRAHVRFLSSDLLEGRGVGVRGGDLAAEYIAAQLALAGAKPAGDNGTYFQKVPLVGIETSPSAELSAAGPGQPVAFRWMDDFVGVSERQQPQTTFEGDAVFAGHGIVAPEFGWDDFKGADVRGKVLVLFTNEPQSSDPAFFAGRALTYYGRWTYKFEQAARLGAAAALIIHTASTAGYGWDVVRNSWGREQPFVTLSPGSQALSFAGWLTSAAAEKLLSAAGQNVSRLLEASESRDFRPIPLGIRIRGAIPSKLRQIAARNVVALIPGNDPKLKDQSVIFSAHYDHLGIGPPVNGDAIYNGAVDNATGCGVLLEIARAWSALPVKPARSALFLSVTAEEGGLRGSQFYGEHPVIPHGKTAINLNYDGLHPFGRTADVVLSGAERTTAWPLVQSAARRLDLTIAPDPRPEQGSYYRSDHFSLARFGIPAFSIQEGSHYRGKPASYGDEIFKEYNARHYHQPSDEYREDWDFSGLEDLARLGFLIGIDAANQPGLPTWKAGDEFLAARERSGVK